MTSTKARAATDKLNQIAQQAYGAISGVPTAASPAAALYGVFGPAQAANLQSQNDGIRGPLSDIALRHGAEDEAARYEAQLRAAQQSQERMQNVAGKYGLMEKVLGKEPDGLIGMRSVGQTADGGYGVINDVPLQAVANDLAINESVAGTRQDNANAIKSLYDSGIKTDPVVAGGYMRNPTQSAPDKYGVFNPSGTSASDATDQFKAESDRIDVNNPRKYARSGGSGGEPSVTVIPGMYGMPPQVSYRGKVSQMGEYLDGQPGPTSTATPKTGLSAVIEKAVAKGMTVTPSGSNVVVTAPNGSTATYDASGKRVK